MNTERKVDVLAVIDGARRIIASHERADICAELREARAAVADLIKADREYDAAEMAWDLLGPQYLGDQDRRDYDGPEYTRLCRAIDRRQAALARIGGAQ